MADARHLDLLQVGVRLELVSVLVAHHVACGVRDGGLLICDDVPNPVLCTAMGTRKKGSTTMSTRKRFHWKRMRRILSSHPLHSGSAQRNVSSPSTFISFQQP